MLLQQYTGDSKMQEPKQNRATRRLLDKGILPSQGKLTPIGKASSLRHKKPYQKKQANKALADKGCSPKYNDV